MNQPPQSNAPGGGPGEQPFGLPGLSPNTTQDAVVVVPGIMGSELYDTTTGTVLWGLANPGWLGKAWTTRKGLRPLHLTEDERSGKTGRVKARRLLRTPAWSPFLRGIEPYHELLTTIRHSVAHQDAILPFAYDWRLPVATNALELATAARDHLEQWRRHPAHAAARKHRVDEREGRLVFIAHSMGGLLTQAALALGPDRDLAADTRGVMTLGTPFQGAVMAAAILNTGQGAPLPLPHGKLRTLASTMPGVHDLLPRFPCLDEGLTVRRLTPADVADLGGDKDLALTSQAFHDRLRGHALPDHRAVVGVSQRTLQSMTLEDGVVTGFEHTFREHTDGELMRDAHGVPRRFPVGGDGTVHKESAARTRTVIPLALQHGALATGDAAMEAVTSFLEEDEHLGPDQAASGLGLTVPDFVTPGTTWEIQVTGTDDPAGITCTVTGTDGGFTKPARLYADEDDALTARIQVPDAGLYRVTVEADGPTPLTQLVLAGPEEDDSDEE
ncbi:lipase/acyltransferase domain-containing protein [Streptomyces chattanoogensis]|uniref:lipase/acyltransferase domain-containing protein n=1 Tax=Streptomyces chattanoogensis TaxID=66876 RepID=UPI0036CD853F